MVGLYATLCIYSTYIIIIICIGIYMIVHLNQNENHWCCYVSRLLARLHLGLCMKTLNSCGCSPPSAISFSVDPNHPSLHENVFLLVFLLFVVFLWYYLLQNQIPISTTLHTWGSPGGNWGLWMGETENKRYAEDNKVIFQFRDA